jgi:DNA-binding NarL/FixJ family response regulator
LLVVDDDVLVLRQLERSLRDQNFSVHTARNLDDARRLIGEHTFDAALIDERLEGARGSVLVGELRTAKNPCFAVMITGSERIDAARTAMSVGADGFLTKPVQDRQLYSVLRQTVERTRQWRDEAEGRSRTDTIAIAPHLSVVASDIGDLDEEPGGQEDSEPPSKTKLLAWPPLPTLGALDIEKCADALAKIGGLTDRERKILVPMLRGEQNNEIAEVTGATPRTVKFHVSNILKKLRITQRAELVRFFF